MYFYWRVITLIGFIANVFELFEGLYLSGMVWYFGGYSAQLFSCIPYTYINKTLTFYRFMLDLVVILDRIATFKPKLKRLLKLPPAINSLILLALVSTLNMYEPVWGQVFSNGSLSDFYIGLPTSFSLSSACQTINNILFFIKHVVVIAAEIGLNLGVSIPKIYAPSNAAKFHSDDKSQSGVEFKS